MNYSTLPMPAFWAYRAGMLREHAKLHLQSARDSEGALRSMFVRWARQDHRDAIKSFRNARDIK